MAIFETISSLMALVREPQTVMVEGRERLVLPPNWQDKGFALPLVPTALEVRTLASIVAWVQGNRDGLVTLATPVPPNAQPLSAGIMAIDDPESADRGQLSLASLVCTVDDPETVSVRSVLTNRASQYARSVFIQATACVTKFPFEQYIPTENAIVGLQAAFAPTPDRDDLVALLSSLREEAVRETTDNGMAQQEVIRRGGITSVERATVKNPVELAPYRTFQEVEQPVSKYVVRLRSKEGAKPEVALFATAGEKWKVDAIAAVGAYLKARLPDLLILA